MSQIIDFYCGDKDIRGRTLEEILSQNNLWLERVHDYIQWVFPNRIPSQYNPNAAILTDEDIWVFQQDVELKFKASRAVKRMEEFYFNSYHWLKPFDHNYLRITRILNFMREIKMYGHVDLFFEKLNRIYQEEYNTIGKDTFSYWCKAAYDKNF